MLRNASRWILTGLFLGWSIVVPSMIAANENPRETPVVKVVRQNAPAVVNISTERVVLLRENPVWGPYGSEFDYYFGQFFGFQQPTRALKLQSVGSGVIVDKEGVIVTNAHVVHMATNVYIILSDGTQVKGKVVYENPQDDLALVRINPPQSLTQAILGGTKDIMIGETVVAIGNPLGLENTVTVGVISGKDRSVSARGVPIFDELLQTDAPINPGNSGGALINLNGELVGINVAVVQNSQSIGFAIPVERVKDALDAHLRNKDFSLKRGQRLPRQKAFSAPSRPAPSSIRDNWDPFSELQRMREEMDEMFQGAFSQRGNQQEGGMFNTDIFYDSQVNIQESKNEYIVRIEIAGLDKNKVDIKIHDGALTVSGERSVVEEKIEQNRKYSSQRLGAFVRTIPLPPDADTDKVKTETQDNVVLIRLPKKK